MAFGGIEGLTWVDPGNGASQDWNPGGAYVIVKPTIIPANEKIACAVAGSAGGEVKWLPLTPSATI